MTVGIIGAGPAGITAAYQLAKSGYDVEVFEAGPAVGGLARTIDLWGQKVDLGPHRFFSHCPRVNALWHELIDPDFRTVNRVTRIYYRNRFFDYPLRPANVLCNMGFVNALGCIASYFKEMLVPERRSCARQTFESWVVGRFGRRLFEMFFRSYSEKLWGIPCSDLSADFAAQRIKDFSLGEALKVALGLSGKKHKTLVDQFFYPIHGTGLLYERMAQRVKDLGGAIHLRQPVQRITHEANQVTGLELGDGTVRRFDHVISTMPLTLLVRGLGDISPRLRKAADSLQFRNTILVYLNVEGTNLFKDQWLYIHSPDVQVGRVTNFRNWVPELYGESRNTILAMEYWCYEEDGVWHAEDTELIEHATQEIRATGLIGAAPVLAGHVYRIPRCYPVFACGYQEHLHQIITHLQEFRGLQVIGRYGAFKYNNQDHSILMGILAAENIGLGCNHDLWEVNTDMTYQEAAVSQDRASRTNFGNDNRDSKPASQPIRM